VNNQGQGGEEAADFVPPASNLNHEDLKDLEDLFFEVFVV
jgi:hypothetical protein